MKQDRETKPEPVEPKPEEVKEPATWTQTTRHPETGDLMTEEKNDAKAD